MENTTLSIGQGVGICGYSDVHAARVVRLSSNGKTAWVQLDKARLLNGVNSGEPDALTFTPGGFCGHTEGTQRWELTADPSGPIRQFSLRRNGRWVQKGEGARNGTSLTLRHRHYHDFNF